LTKSAEQKHAGAQFDLGVMYSNGEGVPQDKKQAVYWYTESAKQGIISAQANLGMHYYFSEGVLKDYKKAFYWYKKAAAQGNGDQRQLFFSCNDN